MNCVIYLRVSTKEQAEKDLSIPAQKDACLKYIQDKGWNFVDCYIDRGESARSVDRPQLRDMLSRIKKDKTINAVVIHKIDRLARNLEDHVAIKAILKKSDVSLVSVIENIEDSASGRLIEGIFAVMAEFYSANLGTEAKKGMMQKAKKGGWPYLAPIGYKNIRDEKGKAKIIPDPEMAPLVQEAFKLYASGDYPLIKLHELMTSKGFKPILSANPISRSRLAKMLRNKAYIGIVAWNEVEYPGIHEPLVSKALFARVQEIFTLHDKAGLRMRKHPHYLRGTLYCGHCGARLSSSLAKGKYVYFYCLGKKRQNGCPQGYIMAEKIESAILKLYKKIQLSPETVKELALELKNDLVQNEAYTLKQQTYILKKKNSLHNERQKLLQAFYANAIPLDLLKQEQNRISDEMTKLEIKQEQAVIHINQIEQVVDMAINMASNCFDAYQKASPNTKRLLNRTFFEKICLKDDNLSGFEYDELFELLLGPKGSDKKRLVPPAGIEPATDMV